MVNTASFKLRQPLSQGCRILLHTWHKDVTKVNHLQSQEKPSGRESTMEQKQVNWRQRHRKEASFATGRWCEQCESIYGQGPAQRPAKTLNVGLARWLWRRPPRRNLANVNCICHAQTHTNTIMAGARCAHTISRSVTLTKHRSWLRGWLEQICRWPQFHVSSKSAAARLALSITPLILPTDSSAAGSACQIIPSAAPVIGSAMGRRWELSANNNYRARHSLGMKIGWVAGVVINWTN